MSFWGKGHRGSRRAIGAERGFIEPTVDWVRYVSLIWIEWVMDLRPLPVATSDQRAWILLDSMPRPNMRVSQSSLDPPGGRVRR